MLSYGYEIYNNFLKEMAFWSGKISTV